MMINHPYLSQFLKRDRVTKKQGAIGLIHNPVWVHCYTTIEQGSLIEERILHIIEILEESSEFDQQIQNLVIAIDITLQLGYLLPKFAEQLALAIFSNLDQRYPELRDRLVGISDDEAFSHLNDFIRTGNLAWEEIDNRHLFVFE
jgi:hypothetical protein